MRHLLLAKNYQRRQVMAYSPHNAELAPSCYHLYRTLNNTLNDQNLMIASPRILHLDPYFAGSIYCSKRKLFIYIMLPLQIINDEE